MSYRKSAGAAVMGVDGVDDVLALLVGDHITVMSRIHPGEIVVIRRPLGMGVGLPQIATCGALTIGRCGQRRNQMLKGNWPASC